MPTRLPGWKKGDSITAIRLNEFSEGINELNDFGIDPPNQPDQGNQPEVQAQINEEETPPEEQSTDVFTESSRVVSTVQIFDQNDENYALIDRIESITFTNANGDTLKLQFTNPVI